MADLFHDGGKSRVGEKLGRDMPVLHELPLVARPGAYAELEDMPVAEDVVAAATSVYPEAAQLLGGGRLASAEGMTAGQKMAFLVDTVELYSTKRKIRAIRSKLDQASKEEADELFGEATALQKRVNELSLKISGQKF